MFWFLTFNFVNISFIFFRTKEIENSVIILKNMFNIKFLFQNNSAIDMFFFKFLSNQALFICFVLSIIICFFFKNSYGILKNNDK